MNPIDARGIQKLKEFRKLYLRYEGEEPSAIVPTSKIELYERALHEPEVQEVISYHVP